MRDLMLRLDTKRCLDGVELIRLDNPPEIQGRYRKVGPIWFFWRSDRYERVEQEAPNLENPLADSGGCGTGAPAISGGRCCGVIRPPASRAQRSMTLRTSRMLPGQW